MSDEEMIVFVNNIHHLPLKAKVSFVHSARFVDLLWIMPCGARHTFDYFVPRVSPCRVSCCLSACLSKHIISSCCIKSNLATICCVGPVRAHV